MSKQEKIVCQGVNFIVRDFDECFESQDNGFTFHAPFILSVNESSIKYARAKIESEIDHGANYEIIREDVGFITNKNRFVDPVEAMKIAVEAEQLEGFLNANYWDGFKGRIGDPETSCKELADEYLKRELKPEDLY